MGSAAPPVGTDFARALFRELDKEARKATAKHGEIDVEALIDILDRGLDELSTRPAVMAFIVSYLTRCMSGSVPDYRTWDPPR